jgi:hypothetical protein
MVGMEFFDLIIQFLSTKTLERIIPELLFPGYVFLDVLATVTTQQL